MNQPTTFKAVSRGRPCPLCDGNDGCSIGADGLHLCRRREGPQPGWLYLGKCNGDPQWSQYRREDDLRFNRLPPSSLPNHVESNGVDWQSKATEFSAALTPALRIELADSLGLPENAIDSLGVGWCSAESCWTFPETDGSQRIIGINRRFRDGSKKAMSGCHRGLTTACHWREREGAVFCPEGASDVLALTVMGLSAVGRPSNTGGVEFLAELFRDLPTDRHIDRHHG